ncbi:MAG: chromate efflux transporter [Thiomicrorhabdus chilensis]|uniref:chromate efflux transporter n=1 Tax=Thiomicrorhabdus chilensis TaxID=63656 RepID=UPI00299E7366|nr:chromate efflux transporter [Thiomicrorhabdus chilensis]MDX1347845.1 chromate efflux transporter [Thiomicrorhabdus chilensis]
MKTSKSTPDNSAGLVLEVFWRFFLLGWVSFGGPAAHLGYFRREFVSQRAWLDEAHYARLVALSQFLPGPGSSQVGFAIGLHRAGFWGGWAAFLGFTLPSFFLLLFVALYQPDSTNRFVVEVINSLKLLAVVVVADAVYGMARSFCRSPFTLILALLTALWMWWFPGLLMQIAALVLAGLLGVIVFKWKQSTFPSQLAERVPPEAIPSGALKNSAQLGMWVFAGLFVATLLPSLTGLFNSNASESLWVLFGHFYQAGSWVFGGGHVVLPLLQSGLQGQVSEDVFLSGYAMAQAVPGPMFTLATYLGAMIWPQAPILGAVTATLGVFLPGLLLVLALNSVWAQWAQRRALASSMAAVNAAVVGLLLAVFVQPVWSSAVHTGLDLLWVGLGLLWLRGYHGSVLWLVGGFMFLGLLNAWLS